MKNLNATIVFMAVIAIFNWTANAQETNETPKWKSFWSKGYQITSSDGNFKMKFGGRIMLDILSIHPDSYYDTIVTFNKGVEFRRLRFFNQGLIYNKISYKLQFDFALGKVVVKDAYLNFSKIPVIGNIRVGHFKEPVGLELLTSSKYITFMERALTNPLTPERNTGIMVFNQIIKSRMTWALGYFLPTDINGVGNYAGNKYHLTGRISALPIYITEGRFTALHLGLSLTHQDQGNEKYKLTTRPETHLSPKLVLAEIDMAKTVNQYGLEAAFVTGPFSIQGEYISANAQTSIESNLQNSSYNFMAYYAYASWFITGEHRNYKTSAGAFDRVSPKKNLGGDGAGAFEVGLRFSNIDLDDTDIQGGTMHTITVGLNWYVNPVTRCMFNYVHAKVKDKGTINGAQLRFQIDF
jgi:phosphate-selective porin OprO/OprP